MPRQGPLSIAMANAEDVLHTSSLPHTEALRLSAHYQGGVGVVVLLSQYGHGTSWQKDAIGHMTALV